MKFFRIFELYSEPEPEQVEQSIPVDTQKRRGRKPRKRGHKGLLPVSRGWIYKAMKDGRFPLPAMYLSDRVPVWSEEVISGYLKGKQAA